MIHTGTYEFNQPGARTLADAQTLTVNGERVIANVSQDGLVVISHGTTEIYSGDLPEHVTDFPQMHEWVCFLVSQLSVEQEEVHTVITEDGTKIHVTVSQARTIFDMYNGFRAAKRARKNLNAAAIQRALRDLLGPLPLKQAEAVTRWYRVNIYDPSKPETCPR